MADDEHTFEPDSVLLEGWRSVRGNLATKRRAVCIVPLVDFARILAVRGTTHIGESIHSVRGRIEIVSEPIADPQVSERDECQHPAVRVLSFRTDEGHTNYWCSGCGSLMTYDEDVHAWRKPERLR